MCFACRRSWSLHVWLKRSTGMPYLSTDVRIDLAVAVFARDLLAAPGRADERAVVAAILGLQLGAVSAAAALRIVVDAAAEAVAGHAVSAAQLDVIPAREAELLVVAPPRHVEVHAADAVRVVARLVHQRRDEAARR